MIDKSQQVQLKKLLSEAVLLLCRNGLPIDSQFSIEAMIGITLSENEVFLISFRETVESSLTETSCDRLTKEPSDEIVKRSDKDCNSRRNVSGVWTSSSTDICGPVRKSENMEDFDDPEQEMVGAGGGELCYDAGFRNCGYGGVIKSEVDRYTKEYSAEFGNKELTNAEDDEMFQNGDFESEVKSEPEVYELDGCERSARDFTASVPVIDTERGILSCRKPLLSTPSAYWPPLNLKGHARSQTLQRSRGSRYSASSEQRQRGPVYLESAESLSAVEKILSAIYPSTDNQSLRCHVCGAGLKCRRTLMEHIRGTHLSIHSYHCPDCGLGFKWRSSLKHHRARNCTLPSVLAAAYDCRPLAR